MPPPTEVGRAPIQIMRIRREDVHNTFCQHTFRPVSRLPAERPTQRATRQLYPSSAGREIMHLGVVTFNPGKTFWVCQNRHKSGKLYLETELTQPRRRHMMRWFDQDVTRVSQRQEMSGADLGHEIRDHVIVGTGHQRDGDACVVEHLLEGCNLLADEWSRVVVDAWQDVRGAGHDLDAVVGEGASHVDRHAKVACAIVDIR